MCVCVSGPKPKVKEDDFGDLLSTQGFSCRADRAGPRTIAEMRRQEISRDMDPLKLQVHTHTPDRPHTPDPEPGCW